MSHASYHPKLTPPRPAQDEVLAPGHTPATVTDTVCAMVLDRPLSWTWTIGTLLSVGLVGLLLISIWYLVAVGVGIWGINHPVGWGLAILNLIWWIGVGHAGTLLAAILLLTGRSWGYSIGRLSESMGLFAFACAGLFPLLHMGRPWFFYWMIPYRNTIGVWPQFRSALEWDIFALLAYFAAALAFWYVGMLPDLASLRDRARIPLVGRAFALLALGWRGEAGQWHRREVAHKLIAGLLLPLIVFHSASAYNLAVSIVPGWHTTMLPSLFAVGALHSGIAMLLVILVPLRRVYRLESVITDVHFRGLGLIMLATTIGMIYAYGMEGFGKWWSDTPFKWQLVEQRVTRAYAPVFWTMAACTMGVPLLLFSRRLRSNTVVLWCIGVLVLAGMWIDRYMVVITSLQQDYLPTPWSPFHSTFWDWALFMGSIGLFLMLLFLFIRLLPAASIAGLCNLANRQHRLNAVPPEPNGGVA